MKIRTIEERLSALEQRAGAEGADVAKVTDTDAKSLAINEWVRKNYTLTEELAIHRKALRKILDKLGIEDEEFDKYDAFVEAHKDKVKNENN